MTISEHPSIIALGESRARLLAAVAYGRRGLLDPIEAMADYRAALADWPLSHQESSQARNDLYRRLDHGWARASEPNLDDYWVTLLRRLEALEDAMYPAGARRRLARLEARIAATMVTAE